MVDRPWDWAARAAVKRAASTATMRRKPGQHRKLRDLRLGNLFQRQRNDGGVVGRHNQNVVGMNFGTAGCIDGFGSPLLHVILKSPVPLEPDGLCFGIKSRGKLPIVVGGTGLYLDWP